MLVICGAMLVSKGTSVPSLLKRFPRSRRAAYVTMTLGTAWVLYRVTQLGEPDFGKYKQFIFIGFLVIAALSFKYAPDFLSVRGACMLYLLGAWVFLRAAFMQYDEPLRLLMVMPLYAGIALALYLAYSPFRVRDFFGWLFFAGNRARILGALFIAYGGLLSGVAFAY